MKTATITQKKTSHSLLQTWRKSNSEYLFSRCSKWHMWNFFSHQCCELLHHFSIYWLITLNRDFINTSPYIFVYIFFLTKQFLYFCECKNKIFSFPPRRKAMLKGIFAVGVLQYTSTVLTVPLSEIASHLWLEIIHCTRSVCIFKSTKPVFHSFRFYYALNKKCFLKVLPLIIKIY